MAAEWPTDDEIDKLVASGVLVSDGAPNTDNSHENDRRDRPRLQAPEKHVQFHASCKKAKGPSAKPRASLPPPINHQIRKQSKPRPNLPAPINHQARSKTRPSLPAPINALPFEDEDDDLKSTTSDEYKRSTNDNPVKPHDNKFEIFELNQPYHTKFQFNMDTLMYRPWVFGLPEGLLWHPGHNQHIANGWSKSRWLEAAGVSTLPRMAQSLDPIDQTLLEDVFELLKQETVYLANMDGNYMWFIFERVQGRAGMDRDDVTLPKQNTCIRYWWKDLVKHTNGGLLAVRDYLFILVAKVKGSLTDFEIHVNPFMTQLYHPEGTNAYKRGMKAWSDFGTTTVNPRNFRHSSCCAIIVRELELMAKVLQKTPEETLVWAAGVALTKVMICYAFITVCSFVHVHGIILAHLYIICRFRHWLRTLSQPSSPN